MRRAVGARAFDRRILIARGPASARHRLPHLLPRFVAADLLLKALSEHAGRAAGAQ